MDSQLRKIFAAQGNQGGEMNIPEISYARITMPTKNSQPIAAQNGRITLAQLAENGQSHSLGMGIYRVPGLLFKYVRVFLGYAFVAFTRLADRMMYHDTLVHPMFSEKMQRMLVSITQIGSLRCFRALSSTHNLSENVFTLKYYGLTKQTN